VDLVTGSFFIRNFFYIVTYITKYMQLKFCCFMRCLKYFFFRKKLYFISCFTSAVKKNKNCYRCQS